MLFSLLLLAALGKDAGEEALATLVLELEAVLFIGRAAGRLRFGAGRRRGRRLLLLFRDPTKIEIPITRARSPAAMGIIGSCELLIVEGGAEFVLLGVGVGVAAGVGDELSLAAGVGFSVAVVAGSGIALVCTN